MSSQAAPRSLVVIETQRVKGYLFASRLLRETRGASLLLDRLNRIETRERAEKAGGEVIYLGGGSGRVLFGAPEDAEAFARGVRQLYREKAWGARVSVAVVPRREGDSFPEWMARGVAESQTEKLGGGEPVPLLGGRWVRPCTSCGREPAEHIPRPDVQGRHLLCASCRRKREMVRSFYRTDKRNWDLRLPVPRPAELRERWHDFALTTLAEAVEARYDGARTLLPRDFDDIGSRSRPGNYLALIYADGNRMGETVREMGRLFDGDAEARAAYARFSEIVDRATREAAAEAILAEVEATEEETAEGETGRFVPAEPILAGGDDLILVVPAQAGLPVARRFLTRFAERSRELQAEAVAAGALARPFAPEGLTTSAGVVLAHESYPASQLVELAAELMKLAKHRASDLAQAKRPEGTLDFMVLHESGSEGVQHRRKTEYRGRLPSGRAARYTERPYTAGEVAELLERVRALQTSAVPRGKLKALYGILFRSPIEAQFEALRIEERWKATGDLDRHPALRRLVDELDRFPFREEPGGDWSTPLSELVEIYDFVPGGTLPVEGEHA